MPGRGPNGSTIYQIHTTGPGEVGGAERYLQELGMMARALGIPTVFLCGTWKNDGPVDTLWQRPESPYFWNSFPVVPVRAFAPAFVERARREWGPTLTGHRLHGEVRGVFARSGVPLLSHVHNYQIHKDLAEPMCNAVTGATRELGRPSAFTLHCEVSSEVADGYHGVPPGFDGYAYASSSSRAEYQARGFASAATPAISGCVSPDNRSPEPSPYRRDDSVYRFILLGRSEEPDKGIEEALLAMRELALNGEADRGPRPIRLVISAPLCRQPEDTERATAALKARVTELGLDGYVELWSVPPGRALDALGACDALVLPSRVREGGRPLAIQEAMWLGMPVFTTRFGGQKETVDLAYGSQASPMLFDPFDFLALARRMAEMSHNPAVHDLYSRLGLQAAKKYFGPEIFRAAHVAFYSQLGADLSELFEHLDLDTRMDESVRVGN